LEHQSYIGSNVLKIGRVRPLVHGSIGSTGSTVFKPIEPDINK
jgi:hypothetical protein